jgi:uncharacterized protein YacL
MGLTAVILAKTSESKLIVLALAVIVCFFLGMTLMSFEKRHQKETQMLLEKMKSEALEKAQEQENGKGEPS